MATKQKSNDLNAVYEDLKKVWWIIPLTIVATIVILTILGIMTYNY